MKPFTHSQLGPLSPPKVNRPVSQVVPLREASTDMNAPSWARFQITRNWGRHCAMSVVLNAVAFRENESLNVW